MGPVWLYGWILLTASVLSASPRAVNTLPTASPEKLKDGAHVAKTPKEGVHVSETLEKAHALETLKDDDYTSETLKVDDYTLKEGGQVSKTFPTCPVPGYITKGSHTFCYKKLCKCYGKTADCSGTGLTYVPSVNWTKEVLFLKFSDNRLATIPDDFFQNVTGIRYLSLSYNQISNISNNAFKVFRKLETLFIDHNYNMTHVTLNPVFEVKSLVCVDIAHGKLQQLPDTIFEEHALPNLKSFYLSFHYLQVINLSMFEHLPQLQVMDWTANTATRFLAGRLKKLKILNANQNRLYNFPDTCDEGDVPFFPMLTELDWRHNLLHAIPSKVCLQRLQILDLSSNEFSQFYTNMFDASQFPKLLYLYLESFSTHIMNISRYAFNNTSLKKVSLMYDNLKFSQADRYSVEMLAGCPNLDVLDLSHTFLSELSDHQFLAFFGHLTKLEELYMGSSHVGQMMVTPQTFANFPRLRVLQMYQNSLTDIPDGTFDNNPRLSQLQLNDNHVKVIRQSTFSQATLRELKSVDLSGNPFSCDCDLRWFSDWLRANFSTQFRKSRSNYTCSSQGHLNVKAFRMVDQACLLDPFVSQIIIFTISFLVITVTGAVTLFRFRWHFRLLLYEAFRGTGELRRRRLEEGVFDYDIFVSYAGPDLDWIRQQLMPELEDRLGLKLCIHERDFLPGGQIVDNIVESVNKSRKVLMVFSNYFVRSQWCQFELQFCLRHVMDYDDTLLVACVDNVASCDMTSAMMAVMKTTTWLQWVERDENAKLAFWGRLLQSLREIRPV